MKEKIGSAWVEAHGTQMRESTIDEIDELVQGLARK